MVFGGNGRGISHRQQSIKGRPSIMIYGASSDPSPPPVPKSNLFLPTVSPLNKEKNRKLKKLLIVRKILLAVALEYVWRTVWTIYILMMGR